MKDLTERAQVLIQEKDQLIVRLYQVDGALNELNRLAQEDQTQEDPTPEIES